MSPPLLTQPLEEILLAVWVRTFDLGDRVETAGGFA